MKFTLLKRLIGLIAQKAPRKQMYLEIGAHFIKKGADYEIGQVLYRQKGQGKKNISKAKVVTNMYFEFDSNKIYVRRNNKFVSPDQLITK